VAAEGAYADAAVGLDPELVQTGQVVDVDQELGGGEPQL
jgi:hypothetical protein